MRPAGSPTSPTRAYTSGEGTEGWFVCSQGDTNTTSSFSRGGLSTLKPFFAQPQLFPYDIDTNFDDGGWRSPVSSPSLDESCHSRSYAEKGTTVVEEPAGTPLVALWSDMMESKPGVEGAGDVQHKEEGI